MTSLPFRITRTVKAAAVERQLVESIREGTYAPGDPLPSLRELAVQYHVHYNTMHAVIGRLAQQGWVTSIERQGIFVARLLPVESATTNVSAGQEASLIHRLGIVYVKDLGTSHLQLDNEVVRAIENEAADGDVRVSHFAVDRNAPQEIFAVLEGIRERSLDGVIVVGLRDNLPVDELLLRLRQAEMPTVVCPLGCYTISPSSMMPVVDADNTLSGVQAAEHLITLGHRDLAMVTYDWPRDYIDQRVAGYVSVCRTNQLAASAKRVIRLPVSQMSESEQERVGKKAFETLPPEVTGVVCINDMVAAGVILAAEKAGRKIGVDISVVGHDNRETRWQHEITTIVPPTQQIGKRAWEKLNEFKGRPRYRAFENIIVPARLLWRLSTGPRPVNG